MTYDVSTVSRMTGIPRATLLAWERRYAVVKPKRLSNGYRAYSEQDVDLLNEIKALTDAGHRVGEAVRIAGAAPVAERTPIDDLIDALGRFDRNRVDILGARLAEQGMPSRLKRVIEPLLDRLEDVEWTEAQRRFVSSWLRVRLQGMLALVGWGPSGRAPMIVARADDHIEAGLVDQLHLVLGGHAVIPLGVAPTDEALATAAKASDAWAVCIGGVDEPDLDWVSGLRQLLEPDVALIAVTQASFDPPEGLVVVPHASEIVPGLGA